MSSDDDPLGARASRPHKPWHSLANRSHFDQPGKEKDLSTKGHEERRRATKGLGEAREGSAKGRQGVKKKAQWILSRVLFVLLSTPGLLESRRLWFFCLSLQQFGRPAGRRLEGRQGQ